MRKKTRKKTIIIADDEPHILELMRLILSKDYKLVLVDNGKDVISAVQKKKPDLILLDVMMPGLNGYEVCEILKNDKRIGDITIAMLSAKGLERDIVQGLEIGADYYITKPFDPIKLEKEIAEILRWEK